MPPSLWLWQKWVQGHCATGEAASASQMPCLHRVPAAGTQGKPTRVQAPPWGLAGPLGPWATLLPSRGWLLMGSVAAGTVLLCRASRPPFAHGLPHVCSRWAAAAARFLPHRCRGKHPANRSAGPASTSPPCPPVLREPERCPGRGAPQVAPAVTPSRAPAMNAPCGPLRKPIHPISPGKNNKKASGADVILQCWADCASMSAGGWALSRVKPGEAAGSALASAAGFVPLGGQSSHWDVWVSRLPGCCCKNLAMLQPEPESKKYA